MKHTVYCKKCSMKMFKDTYTGFYHCCICGVDLDIDYMESIESGILSMNDVRAILDKSKS